MPPGKTFGAIHVSFVPNLGIRGLVMSLNPNRSQRNNDQLAPWTIRHDSLFKAVWDWVILILVMYTAIEIPFSVTFVLTNERGQIDWFWEDPTVSQICNLIVDLMFVIDIIINFRSTYVEDETDEIVGNPRKIACHYFKTWFVVDFVAAIPFDYIFSYETTKGGATPQATMLVGLLKTARLLRLVRVARKLDRYSEYGTAVVVLLTCLFTLVAHWLACIWHYIGYSERDDEFGWLNKLEEDLQLPGNSTADIKTKYVTALYFTLSSLTSVGFGNVSPNTNAEKIFSISVMIIGALMYASIFGNLTAIIQRLYSRSSHYHRRLRIIEEFVKFHKVPKALRDEMQEYFRHEWACTNGVDMGNVLHTFPESLRADVCLHLHRNLFTECLTFKSASEGCMRALAVRFKVFHYLPGHCIIKQGDEVNKLYFICKGVVEVVKDGETVLTLGKGDTISCDYSTAQSSYIPQADASLRLQTHGIIHSVAWSDLFVVLKAYPDFKEDFLGKLEIAYNLGQLDEDREVSHFTSETGPGPRRLSNARSNLSATPVIMDSCEQSGSPTLIVNGGFLPTRTVLAQHVRRQSDPRPPNLVSSSAGPSSFVYDQEFWHVERRLNGIEEKIAVMESKFARTLDEILKLLHQKESSLEDENADHRTTIV